MESILASAKLILYRRLVPLLAVGATGLILTGCPAGAELDDADLLLQTLPEEYADGDACDATDVFEESCGFGAICHQAGENGAAPGGGVDLVAPNVAERLLDVQATFPGAPQCEGTVALLIDSQSLDESYLWKKVNNTHGECGDAMPTPYSSLNQLSLVELDCLRSWIESFVAATP